MKVPSYPESPNALVLFTFLIALGRHIVRIVPGTVLQPDFRRLFRQLTSMNEINILLGTISIGSNNWSVIGDGPWCARDLVRAHPLNLICFNPQCIQSHRLDFNRAFKRDEICYL